MHQKVLCTIAAALSASPLAALENQWDLPCGYYPSAWGDCGNRYFAEVDYLLWYANEDGLGLTNSYAIDSITNTTSIATFNNIYAKERTHFFKHGWNSGVRATLGFKEGSRGWDVRGIYAYFATSAKRFQGPVNVTTSDDGASFFVDGAFVLPNYFSVLDNLLTADGTDFTTTAFSKWSLCFNQFDLELGREFFVGCDFSLRPFFGARALWLNQRIVGTTHFAIDNSSISPPVTDLLYLFDPHSRYEGYGARVGFDAAVNLLWGLDVYGCFAGNILWGRHHVRQTLSTYVNGTDNASLVPDDLIFGHDTIDRPHQASVLNLDLRVGLKWNQMLFCNRSLLTVKFGWEQHFYSGMNQLQNFLISEGQLEGIWDHNVYRGDLTLSGFTFGIGFLY